MQHPFETGERFGMAAACALAMYRGMDIFICSSETPAGVSELLFHGRGAIAGNGIYCKNLRIVLKSEPILIMQKGAAARCSSP